MENLSPEQRKKMEGWKGEYSKLSQFQFILGCQLRSVYRQIFDDIMGKLSRLSGKTWSSSSFEVDNMEESFIICCDDINLSNSI